MTAYDTSLGWRFPNPSMAKIFPLEGMGETAENLVERHGISGKDGPFCTQQPSESAQSSGRRRFAEEVLKVEEVQRKGPPTVKPDGTRDSTIEKLGALRASLER